MSDKLLPLKLIHEYGPDAFLTSSMNLDAKEKLYFGFLVGTDLISDTVNNHIP